MTYVTPDSFETLEIHPLQGRVLAASDSANGAKVTVIKLSSALFSSQAVSLSARPSKSATTIGRSSAFINDIPAGNGWGEGMGPIDRFPQIYVTAEQFPNGSFALVNTWFSPNWLVRTHGTVAGLPHAMRHALQSVDPTLPFSSFQNMAQIRGASLATQCYQAILFSSLAGLARPRSHATG
jgi:hypothetical protein